jgi:LPXTG-motif cell wall-anchored protein
MKTKSFVSGLLILFVFGFNAGILNAQEKEGTFIEESGDAQDSTKTANILDYSKEFGEQKSSNTGMIIGITAAVLAGGAVIYLVRKKRKK